MYIHSNVNLECQDVKNVCDNCALGYELHLSKLVLYNARQATIACPYVPNPSHPPPPTLIFSQWNIMPFEAMPHSCFLLPFY